MVLGNLRKNFAGRAAAIGLSALTALTPLSAVYADSAGQKPVLTATAPQSILTQEQRARVDVLDEAYDYALQNPGHLAVSVLEGPDSGDRTGSELAGLLERGFEKRHNIQTAGYAGDNGHKPTEITFHFLMIDTDNSPLVRSMGPYNMGDALKKIPDVVEGIEAAEHWRGLARYVPSNN